MRPVRPFTLLVVAALLIPAAQPTLAQSESDVTPPEGYVQSLRSVYKTADASSETVGLLRPGDFVRVEHVHSLMYRVYRQGENTAIGYVVYPKLGSVSPLDDTPVRTAVARVPGDDASGDATRVDPARKMWVHAFVNIRSGPSTRDAVVAQLPPGSPVLVSGKSGRWMRVFKPAETVFEAARALGFVHESLLRATEPPPEVNPLIAAERTNTGAAAPTSTTDIGQAASSVSSDVINVNTANRAQLESLPRIGPVLAGRIIEYRDKNGGFKRVDDLVNIKGIGDKTLERLRPYVTVGQ